MHAAQGRLFPLGTRIMATVTVWKYDKENGIYSFDSSELDMLKTLLLDCGYEPEVFDETATDGDMPLDATEPRLGQELSFADNLMAVSTDGNGLADDE